MKISIHPKRKIQLGIITTIIVIVVGAIQFDVFKNFIRATADQPIEQDKGVLVGQLITSSDCAHFNIAFAGQTVEVQPNVPDVSPYMKDHFIIKNIEPDNYPITVEENCYSDDKSSDFNGVTVPITAGKVQTIMLVWETKTAEVGQNPTYGSVKWDDPIIGSSRYGGIMGRLEITDDYFKGMPYTDVTIISPVAEPFPSIESPEEFIPVTTASLKIDDFGSFQSTALYYGDYTFDVYLPIKGYVGSFDVFVPAGAYLDIGKVILE